MNVNLSRSVTCFLPLQLKLKLMWRRKTDIADVFKVI